jgi:hypothetical protein
MKRFYHGNRKPYVLVVSHPQDRKAVQPVLEEMDSRGLYLCHREGRDVSNYIIRRACTVVLFLSQALDEDKVQRIALEAKESEVPVIFVYLEQEELPEGLKRLMFASNAILAKRYNSAGELADRLLTAESLRAPQITNAQQRSRKRTMRLLSLLAFLSLAAAFIVFALPRLIPPIPPAPSPSPVQVTAAPTPVPTVDPNTLVERLILAGDVRLDEKQYSDTDWSARVWQHENNGEAEWMLDGKTLSRGTAESLAFIQSMVNLKELVLINQKFTDLSPLAGLKKLRSLQIIDCPVEDIGTLVGAQSLSFLELRDTAVSDLTGLEDLPSLSSFSYSGLSGTELTSLKGLSGTGIRDISLRNVNSLKDLSPLENCKKLSSLFIEGASSLTDISALEKCTFLNTLDLYQATSLRDLSALAGTSLRWMNLGDAGVSDLSSLSGLKTLRGLSLWSLPLSDMSFLSKASQLEYFHFGDTRLHNLDFLKKYSPARIDNLGINDPMDDYSGLKAMKRYQSLNLNMHGKSLAALGGILRDLTVSELILFNCRDIDFAALPQSLTSLSVHGGNLQDLSKLENLPNLREIDISNINTLVSLSGMENYKSLKRFSVDNCLRLSDWDAMYSTRVDNLTLKNLVFLPEMERLEYSGKGNFSLTLENLPELKSLSFMDSIPYDNTSRSYSNIEIRLIGMDHLINLEPVRRLSPTFLAIPPTLEEQAAQMVEAKDISGYQVVYSDSSTMDGSAFNFQLLTLDELDTLPDVLLDKVKSFQLAGDTLINEENSHVENWWDNSGPVYYAVDNNTGERISVGKGLLYDLSGLSRLKGLTRLELAAQPLNDLTGIQHLAELKDVHFDGCWFTDASPVFTLTELESVGFSSTPVESLTGLQNLHRLIRLDLNNSNVHDITALRETDFTRAYEQGGLILMINSIPCKDLSPLTAVRQFNELHVMGMEASRWLPHISESTVTHLLAHDCRLKNSDIPLLAAIPGLKDLEIPYNQEVTDLSPLLASETLERLFISADMRGALKDIGESARFEIVMDESNYGLLNLEELDTLSSEELTKVKNFVLVGDYLLVGGNKHAENRWENDRNAFYIVDNDTGEAFPAGAGILTDLKRLSGLTGLEHLELTGQPLETLEGIQNFKRLISLNLNGSAVSDISAIKEADFSYAYEGGGLSLLIGSLPCEDLSPLSVIRQFNELNINADASLWLPHLSESSVTRLLAYGCRLKDSDIPLLAAIPGLKDLEIPYNQEVTDLSPLLASETLERLFISADMRGALRDIGEGARFEIVMDESNYGLLNMEELDTLSSEELTKVKNFVLVGDYLLVGGNKHAENRWENNRNLCYIVDNNTGEALPAGAGILTDIKRLSGLTGLEHLELIGQPLETLEGIQSFANLRNAFFSGARFTDASPLFKLAGVEVISFDSTPVTTLEGIQNLKRLVSLNLNNSGVSDISALKETDFSYAYEGGGFSLMINRIPCEDLSPLAAVRHFNELQIMGKEASLWLPHISESTVTHLLAHDCRLKDSDIPLLAAIPGLKDLEINNNQEVTDLSPLLASETLERLFISADMRGALKDIGESARFEIVMDESNFELLNLEELDTLPAEQLAKVRSFTLAGEYLLTGGNKHIENRWKNNRNAFYIVDNNTGEAFPAGKGILTDMKRLSGLTGLERLELIGQPLETLEGIQSFTNLRDVNFNGARFKDASPLFELAGVERISFDTTPVTTLEGIQNLKRLESLNLNSSAVSDISAFKEIDFSYAYERGGFSLLICNIPCKDLSPLAAVQQFNELHVVGREASQWLPYLSESSVTRLLAHSCRLKNSDIPLLAAIPGLKDLEIPDNQKVTDLSPLLALETLERLTVSQNMKKAVKSLGEQVGFEVIFAD